MSFSKQRFFAAIFFITICLLVFFLGYNFGQKPNREPQTPKIEIKLPNRYVENSLTKIQIKPILGVLDASGTPKEVGKMYYVINKSQQTELLLRLENLPTIITGNKQQQPIPNELSIHLARRTTDGSDYEYEFIGSLNLIRLETESGAKNGSSPIQSGEFSTILDYNFMQNTPDRKIPERLEIYAINKDDPSTQNIFINTNLNLPIQIRGDQNLSIIGKPSPYFWVELTQN
jgi:hypothetical protein